MNVKPQINTDKTQFLFVDRSSSVVSLQLQKAGILRTLLSPQSHAGVAELADALDSGSSKGNLVEVRVLSSALSFYFLGPSL
jgi:hypothetical protein